MRKFAMMLAAAALMTGSMGTVAVAQAAQTPHDTTVYGPTPTPTVQPLDCQGGTGNMGCGPGWFWRNGDQGWRCYPC